MSTPRTGIEDTFNGDNEHLRASIKALISLNDSDSLVPHGIGGHARALLASSYHRIAQLERELEEAREEIGSLKAQAIELQIKACQLTAAKSALEKAREALNEVDENCGYSTNGSEFKCEFCDSQGKEINQIKHDDDCFQPIIESALTAINEVLNDNPPSTTGPLPAPNKEQSNHK